MTVTKYTSDFREYIDHNPKSTQILAEGDSWFAIPKLDNLIKQLDNRGSFNILNLASSGDEAIQMVTWKQKKKIHRLLLNRDNEFNFKVFLFSGGGNDIVGPEIWHIFKDYAPGTPPEDCFNETMLNIKLKQIEMSYREIIGIRDNLQPDLPIVTHCYDYARPSGDPFKFIHFPLSGPWIRPSMEDRGIPPQIRQTVINLLMEKVRDMLKSVELDTTNFAVVDTLGTITDPQQWNDELHPKSNGFEKIFTERIEPALTSLGIPFNN